MGKPRSEFTTIHDNVSYVAVIIFYNLPVFLSVDVFDCHACIRFQVRLFLVALENIDA